MGTVVSRLSAVVAAVGEAPPPSAGHTEDGAVLIRVYLVPKL